MQSEHIMFFLRCGFFLSIVYISIAFGSGMMRNPHAFDAAVASDMTGVANSTVARATDWCAERPTRCARDVARLTALVETAMAEPVSGGDEVVLSETEAHAPGSVASPRRRAARAVLTDAP